MKVPYKIITSWLDSPEALIWKKKIIDNIHWEKPIVKVFSKSYPVPRLTTFLSTRNITYIYSGFKHIGSGWPEWFYPLLDKVRDSCGVNFNGCLINLYRDGRDRMGWHSDNEKELNHEKPIASLSLGSSRDFLFKHKKQPIKESITLSNGDLLIMQPKCQSDWIHSLPSRKRVKDARVNLTFRCYL